LGRDKKQYIVHLVTTLVLYHRFYASVHVHIQLKLLKIKLK